MTFMKMKFVKSAFLPADYPPPSLPEMAFIGRSNSGKSSLLNALSYQKMARVSKIPGQTQLLNFFQVQDICLMVDLPGYGYAKRSKATQKMWQKMVECYFKVRPSLVGLILIMDIRRPWSPQEQQLLDWLQINQLKSHREKHHLILVLNKCDKLNRHQQRQQKQKIQAQSNIQEVFVTSCHKKQGIKALQRCIFKMLDGRKA